MNNAQQAASSEQRWVCDRYPNNGCCCRLTLHTSKTHSPRSHARQSNDRRRRARRSWASYMGSSRSHRAASTLLLCECLEDEMGMCVRAVINCLLWHPPATPLSTHRTVASAGARLPAPPPAAAAIPPFSSSAFVFTRATRPPRFASFGQQAFVTTASHRRAPAAAFASTRFMVSPRLETADEGGLRPNANPSLLAR